MPRLRNDLHTGRTSLHLQHFGAVGLFALLYFFTALASRSFVVQPENLAAIWPPSGLLLAVLLVSEQELWPAVLGSSGLANLLANLLTGAAFWPGIGFAFANVAEGALAIWLLKRNVGLPLTLLTLREVLRFTLWAVVVGNAVTALAGAAVSALAFSASFWAVWRLWWIADALGMLLVTPLALAGTASLQTFRRLSRMQRFEFVAMLGVAATTGVLIYGELLSPVLFNYYLFPLLIWAAIRFRHLGATSASFLLAGIVLWNTMQGQGPFANPALQVSRQVLESQIFLSVSALSALILAAVTAERQQARDALEQANRALEQRVSERTAALAQSNQRLQHEVSERQRAEAFLNAVVQQMPAGVSIAEAPSGRLLIHNSEAVNVLGHPMLKSDDYTGYNQYGALHPDGRPYAPGEHAMARAVRNHEIIRQEAMLYRRGDGTITALSVNAAPIRDAEGRVIAAVTIFEDISARMEAERVLRESEERFAKTFYSNVTAMVISTLNDGRILDANERFLKLFGYPREAVIGQSSILLNMWDNPDDRTRAITQIREQGELRDMETTVRDSAGNLHQVLISSDQLLLAGERCILTTLYDITERRQLETRLAHIQNMESIGQLAGGVAHDFNNMLTAIRGYAELALGHLPANNPGHEDIRGIMQAADRATTLTRQLLTFARRQRINPRIINLNTLIEELDRLLRRLIPEHIEIALRLAPGLLPIRADPGQIEQVLINLVANARDAMLGGGLLTIETANVILDHRYALSHLDIAPGRYVLLTVSDTGVGMAAEVQRHAFEPFFTTKEPGKGTGLGLSTCYGIAKQHGGTIWIYSEEGHGTVIKVYLPEAAEAAAPAMPPVREQVAQGSETLLLVEDEDAVRALVARLLRTNGYTVLEAANGIEALQIAEAHRPAPLHLLLTDMIMPRMGGTETAEQIRLLYPAIKVLFMSGYTEHPTMQNHTIISSNLLLQKPFTSAELARRIRELLDA